MAFGWGQKSLSPIGVDFGYDSLKLIQIQADDPPQLIAAATAEVPEDARRSPDAYQRFVADTLGELIRSARFKGRRAIASISAANSYVQHLRLPKCEGELFEQQMEAELRARLPLSSSGLVIRHVVVGEVFADGGAKQEVICIAASRDSVMRLVQAARSSGLDLVGMHAEPMALLASFDHLFMRQGDESRRTLFVDIGAVTTKAVISHGAKMIFAKTIHIGGEHFHKQLAERERIPLAEARSRRIAEAERARSGGEPTDPGRVEDAPSRRERHLDAAGPGEPAETATATVEAPARTGRADLSDNEMLEAMVDELRLCLGYHDSTFPDKPVGKIVFIGGESRQIQLCKRIAHALHLPAQLGDPLARLVRADGSALPIGLDMRRSQPGWAVPMGLCHLPSNL